MLSLDAQRARLRDMLRERVPEHADAILAIARASVRLVPVDVDDPDAAAGTVLGGEPRLPDGVPWPSHGERPLVFLAQIDLAEVAATGVSDGLPETGLLTFFTAGMWLVEDESIFEAYGSVGAVVYVADPDAATPRALPYGEGDTDPVPVRRSAVRLVPELCLPPVEGPDIDPLGLVGTNAHTAYWDGVWMDRLAVPDEPYHRLLGHPDMNYNHHMTGTRLLFQMDSDDEIGWEFGDFQALRFLIPPAGLEAADFATTTVNGAEE